LQRAHRTVSPRLIVTALVLAAAGSIGYRTLTNGPDLQVTIVEVGGYTENVPIWMPFKVKLRLRNAGNESITIRRIDIEPDLDDFNEAFSVGSPYDLSPPILLEPGAERTHELSLTLLNANQLPERMYMLVFNVSMRTDRGEIMVSFPTQFLYFRDPARRVLRLGA
jgi:hypothetical protein